MARSFSNEIKSRVENTKRPFLQRDFEAGMYIIHAGEL